MTPRQDAQAVLALERIADALEHIAAAVSGLQLVDGEDTSLECRHPAERRLQVGQAGWQCGVCGHREDASCRTS